MEERNNISIKVMCGLSGKPRHYQETERSNLVAVKSVLVTFGTQTDNRVDTLWVNMSFRRQMIG